MPCLWWTKDYHFNWLGDHGCFRLNEYFPERGAGRGVVMRQAGEHWWSGDDGRGRPSWWLIYLEHYGEMISANGDDVCN